MAGDSSMGLGSPRPLVSQGVTRPSLRARTVARGQDPAFRKAGPGRGPSRVEAPMAGPAVCVGIDVSKATLDLALRPTGEQWTVVQLYPGPLLEPITPFGVGCQRGFFRTRRN